MCASPYQDPRPKVGLDYSSGCTNVCADTKSNDFKCQLNNMAYTLFDNYTDTCLEDGMKKGLPCFKVCHFLDLNILSTNFNLIHLQLIY